MWYIVRHYFLKILLQGNRRFSVSVKKFQIYILWTPLCIHFSKKASVTLLSEVWMEPVGWFWCRCRCRTKAYVLTSFDKVQATETTLVCYNGQYDSLQILNSPTHHRRKVLSVWYLKQTICFCINIRIREGGFFPGRVYLFWQRMTDKNQIRSRKLQRVHRNRQQIFLCVFLPKLGLQSFEVFSLAIWDLSSPSPYAFLLSPFWLLWFMTSLLPCY